jgi:predicted nucleic acid-binding protein
MIVVDANVVAYFWIASPFTNDVSLLFERDPVWFSTELCRSEFRSIMAGYLRRGMYSKEEAVWICNQMENHMEATFRQVKSPDVLTLVAQSQCSSYDCEYVVLAKALSTMLVTYDKQVLNAFPEIAIKPLDYLARL